MKNFFETLLAGAAIAMYFGVAIGIFIILIAAACNVADWINA